jgi:hypothetical protein
MDFGQEKCEMDSVVADYLGLEASLVGKYGQSPEEEMPKAVAAPEAMPPAPAKIGLIVRQPIDGGGRQGKGRPTIVRHALEPPWLRTNRQIIVNDLDPVVEM